MQTLLITFRIDHAGSAQQSPAESVDARLLGGALVVAHAAGRVLQLHRLAAPVRDGDPAGAARADHGPEGDGVDHAADGGRVARAQLVARVAAPLIQA